ncbi:uncharacterized protein B0T15DRAFT_24361 [Chaetomium strumarium]|uniref:Uncharacterized protein n=1 Tax=Chaetomium strumarium TaxID=1170767 RepID=A0AAJ0M605_9PEZI|nr:hypothetical protein B0T15DRAFT_24361 [Chaetomium strumarium]
MEHREGISANIVCSSLRHRPAWASAVTQLLESDRGRWLEASLRTHDVALSITEADSQGQGVYHSEYSEHPVFRLLLLSPEDINDPRTLPRVEQLHCLDNGRNAALIFLLDHDKSQSPMQPFMELHLQLPSNRTLPIIPLLNANDLPTTLRSFQSSLTSSRDMRQWPVDPARDLLPFCNITSSPLSRCCVDALSKGFFASFRELLEGIATEEGQSGLREVLELATGKGNGEVDRLIAFWKHEFATG